MNHMSPSAQAQLSSVQQAVQAARQRQSEWAARSLSQRADALKALAAFVLSRADELTQILADETGRSLLAARFPEVALIGDYVKGAVKVGQQALAPEKIKLSPLDMPGKRGVIEQVPRGVVGVIAPWNYPLLQLYKPVFPALLAGNTVVIKPSEYTPRCAEWLAAACDQTLGEGIVRVVQGDGAVGEALIHAGIDALTFTGSVRTGRKVAAAAAGQLIPCSVELGGKDAAIVLDDCNLDRTVSGIAYTAFHNAGQDCAGIERVFVQQAISDTFVARLTAAAGALRVGNTENSEVAPIQNDAQLAVVEAHVADALAKGATLLCGGHRVGEGRGYAPTVLDHCTDDMLVMAEETFGPVVAIRRVQSAEEAVALANNSPYGLNGSVWTTNLTRGEQVARQLDVGLAHVNGHGWTGSQPHIPWTGTGETGPGVAGSRFAYPTFARPRVVMVDKNKKAEPFWFPFDPNMDAFSLALMERSSGSFGALFKLLGLLGKRVNATGRLGQD